MLAPLLARFDVPGASLAVWDGARIETRVAGVADRASGAAVTAGTRFQIGSVTKLLTAALARRHLPLAAGIARWLPEWAGTDKAELTPALLLAHRSGLDGDAFEPLGDGAEAAAALLRLTRDDPLLHRPGAAFSYCNLGFVALGLAVARATARAWPALVAEELAGPAGADSISEADRADDAVGHVGGVAAPVAALPASNAAAGTTLKATAADLLRVLRRLPALDEGGGPVALVPPGLEVRGFGLGPAWFAWDRVTVGHDGQTIGQQAFARLWPESGVAVVLLANGGDMRGMARAVLSELGARLAGARADALPAPAAGDLPPVGRWARRNASLVVTADGGLARYQQEAWAERVHGTEGPWPLLPAGPERWLWQVPGQSVPVPVWRVADADGAALHLGMRRYNRAE